MDSIEEIENLLFHANERLIAAMRALAPKHKGGEMERYLGARQQVLHLERKLAAVRNEQYAETIDFPRWDIGAPLPQLVQNEHRTFLAFLLSEPDPAWDGTWVTIKSPAAEIVEPLGLIEFQRCMVAKLGPTDDYLERHPLNGRGMEPYRAQRVINSNWIQEIKATYPRWDPNIWNEVTHYIFWFHDSTFECIARSFKVEIHRTSMPEMLSLMVKRLVA